jgi:hypothetical protein
MHRPRRLAWFLLLAACTGNETPASTIVAAPPVPVAAPQPSVTASPTPPAIDLAALNALLRRCNGDDPYPLGTVAGAERLGPWGDEPVYLAHMTGDPTRRVLLFDAPGDDCPAFILGAGASVPGDFLGEGITHTAILLSQSVDSAPCDDDDCPVAVLVRDEGGAVLSAIRPGLACNAAALSKLRLFPDRDSLELRCTTGDVDAVRTVTLFHAFDRTLRPLATFDHERITIDPESDDRICTRRSTGSHEITATGVAPALAVLAVNDRHEGSHAVWTFSPTEQRLVAGPRTPTKLRSSTRTCESP